MATGWIAILKHVPWSEVVRNAPLIAEGARKLWNAVAKKPAAALDTSRNAQASRSPEARAVSALESRVAVLEAGMGELQNQMMASSDLINALADQNAQLIHRIQSLRIRVLWLAGVLVAAAIATVTSAVWALMR